MANEEQEEEKGALKAIYDEEIIDLSDDEYLILIRPDAPEEVVPAPWLLLGVTYPADYPMTAPPLLRLEPPDRLSPQLRGLVAPQGGGVRPFFSPEEAEELLAGVGDVWSKGLGAPVIFDVVIALKDAAEALVISRLAAAKAIPTAREVEAEAEQEEAARARDFQFAGEPVTPSSFAIWRDRFRRQMADEASRRIVDEEEALRRPGVAAKPREAPGLTGRQLWTLGLAVRGDEEQGVEEGGLEDEALVHAVVEAAEKLAI